MTPLCATRPSDWWMVPDDGNRLALLLCSVCPALPGCGAGREYGVIRAGVAWNDVGQAAGLCGCGYPLPLNGADRERPSCYRCVLPQARTPGRLRQKRRRGDVAEHFEQIGVWRGEGLTWDEIARRLRMRKSTVRLAAQEHFAAVDAERDVA